MTSTKVSVVTCEQTGRHTLHQTSSGVECVVCDFQISLDEFWQIVFAVENPTNLVN